MNMVKTLRKKTTFRSRTKKFRKACGKRIYAVRCLCRRYSNINRYNRYLFIFETILLVGVIDEFLEGLIMQLDYGIFLNIALLMFSIGVLFYFALQFIERLGKGTIIWIVRLNKNKILRVAAHIVILALLFYLYAKVFYGTELGLVLDIGVTTS